MNLVPIAKRLDTRGVGKRTGSSQNIFVHHFPEQKTVGILLRQSAMGTPIDHNLPGYFRSKFQLIARATSYEEGRALAQLASDELTMLNIALDDGMYMKQCLPTNQPVAFPSSKGDLLEFSVNFDVAFND